MYTLAIEVHGLRQVERLQPELVADIRRRVIAVVEVQGGAFAATRGGLWIFRFERARPDDRQGVLDALAQTMSLLEGRESELSGWTVVLDYLELPTADAADAIHDALLPVYEENAAWLGEAAFSLLSHQVAVPDAPADGRRLHRIEGLRGVDTEEVGAVVEYARSARGVDALLDALSGDQYVGRMLLVVSDDPVALRACTRGALEELMGASPAVHWLEAEADSRRETNVSVNADSGIPVLASLFTRLHAHETPFWLSDAERGSWESRATLVEALIAGRRSGVLPDSLRTDLLIALESYLLAFVRRAAASVVPPVLVCNNVDRWPSAAIDSLVRTVGRLPRPTGEPALTIVGTSSRSLSGAGISELVAGTVRLPRPTVSELRDRSGMQANWDRVMRLTHGRSTPVVHYLTHADHWDALTEGQLDQTTESDLAWRVVSTQDSEIQELLLAAHYAGPFVSRDQYTEIAVRLGTDRIRVPSALERLRALGLLEDRQDVVPAHPDHRGRLETSLGTAARTVYEKVARALLDLIDQGSVPTSEELVHLLGVHADGDHVPRLYHRLLSRALDERRVEEAQRLLYDSVPPRGFGGGSRACMQAVVAANRMRLALLQGNMQAAERTRAQSDRTPAPERCGSVAGDLAVQKARLTFYEGPTKETVALLKRAVMVYQDLDDQAGLARANLDFGLVMLAQEDLLGAREYVLLAGKAAANSDDAFEQIRARQLSLVCDFVYGNLSRALSQAEDLDAAAGQAGMREVQLFAELARGRSAFELGRYEEAADLFSRGRSRARLYAMHAPGLVMERWLARSLVYDGRLRRGLTILRDHQSSPESAFFIAEALLRSGEHAEAIELLEQGGRLMPQASGAVEGIGWATGYSSLEDRAIGLISGTQVLAHQMMALRGYILAESGRTALGVEEMHRLTRELRISEIDPYNRIYFYLYSLILPESGELNLEDGTTVLGKAVRYIQQRTSRMDEYAHKTDFLRRNHWNARLMSHAQAHNLV